MRDFPLPPPPPSWLWQHREGLAFLCVLAVLAGLSAIIVSLCGWPF
jgi:hypothetical protein